MGFQTKFSTDDQVAKSDPVRHAQLLEYSQELLRREPTLYRRYGSKYCLECHRPREIPHSRYCNNHYRVYSRKYQEDIRSGRNRKLNYAYTDPGFNEGMNAYVHDKGHYQSLADYFSKTEHLENVG